MVDRGSARSDPVSRRRVPSERRYAVGPSVLSLSDLGNQVSGCVDDEPAFMLEAANGSLYSNAEIYERRRLRDSLDYYLVRRGH
jgi:hypothetical protein